MADITLAEFNGRVWLVGGEPFIDDLLANTLADDVSIELVPCENKSEVMGLWTQLSGPQQFVGDPWLINPAIVARIRRTLTHTSSVFFSEWSVALDRDAMTIIASMATFACENEDAVLELVEFLDPAGPKALADLARLRAQLIEDSLAEAGVARERIRRATRGLDEVVGVTKDSQRIDIATRLGN